MSVSKFQNFKIHYNSSFFEKLHNFKNLSDWQFPQFLAILVYLSIKVNLQYGEANFEKNFQSCLLQHYLFLSFQENYCR